MKNKNKENKILCPNCSEYCFQLKLTESEKKLAIKWAKKLIKDKKDLKFFIKDESSPLFIEEDSPFSFINEEYVGPYDIIKTIILEKRGKGKIKPKDMIKLI